MTGMADNETKTERRGTRRSPRERVEKLARAALNADMTVEQLDAILSGLTETLDALDDSISSLDETLDRLNITLNRVDEIPPALLAVVERMDGVVDRVERLVDVGETALSPLTLTENAVRSVVNAITGGKKADD
jgi:ABC-type transporter Mla subunit MlaD